MLQLREKLSAKKPTLSCLACGVSFNEPQSHRAHFKAEWHRYNMMRKVGSLPPITEEEFYRRVLEQTRLKEKETQDQGVYCTVCQKPFGTQKSFNNHTNSRKHRENAARANCENVSIPRNPSVNEPNEIEYMSEDEDSSEWEDISDNPIDNNECIFCLHNSPNFLKNVEHMTVTHSFFIPDIEYCTDVEGLLRYLGDKISNSFICLWCNEKGKTFQSAESVRQHMIDKGHCKMIHDGIALAEYVDFYDYSKSYPDADSEDVDVDEEVSLPELEATDYQLVLPSGFIVGHRSLMKYYKQNSNTNRTVAVAHKDNKLHKVLGKYRTLGWTPAEQSAAARRAKDLHYMKRIQSKFMMKMGIKNNKNIKRHFRIQVQF